MAQGRLSKDDIEQMIKDAEKYKAEDEAFSSKVGAKNGLESYCYSMKNTLNDEKFKDKLEAADKEKLETAINGVIQWIDDNPNAEKVPSLLLPSSTFFSSPSFCFISFILFFCLVVFFMVSLSLLLSTLGNDLFVDVDCFPSLPGSPFQSLTTMLSEHYASPLSCLPALLPTPTGGVRGEAEGDRGCLHTSNHQDVPSSRRRCWWHARWYAWRDARWHARRFPRRRNAWRGHA